VYVPWRQIVGSLSPWIDGTRECQPRHRFLLDQVASFLQGKGATVADLDRALQHKGTSLAKMNHVLNESIRKALGESAPIWGIRPAKAGSHKKYAWDGIYFRSPGAEEDEFSLGFNFDDPTRLVFATCAVRLNTDCLTPEMEGEIIMWHSREKRLKKLLDENQGLRWRSFLALDGFFKMDRTAQIALIERFLRRCLEDVGRLRVPRQ
jgi:hypothetical protein